MSAVESIGLWGSTPSKLWPGARYHALRGKTSRYTVSVRGFRIRITVQPCGDFARSDVKHLVIETSAQCGPLVFFNGRGGSGIGQGEG
jgi:hypothetical protein